MAAGDQPTRRGTTVPTTTEQTEQYLLNYSFDTLHKLLMMGLLAYNANQTGPDGNPGRYDRMQIDDFGGLLTRNPNATARYDIQSPVFYIGEAPVGSSEGSSVWVVTKIDITSNPYTEKIATNVAWSGRAGATYA